MRSGKAQSSLEYISTYAWAITVVVIIAALLYLFSSLPSTAPPTKCTFISGVYCDAMVVQTNSLTHQTTMALFLTNSQPYPMANPNLFAKINGKNTTSIPCSPNYVLAGGSLVCTLTLPSLTSLGQFLAGQLYLNATYCALQANYSQANMCSGAPRETYSGSFNSHVEPLIGTNTVITLTARNSTQPANGALDPLTATIKLLGYPLHGATVNFTANLPGYTISPNFTTTNTTGAALSQISGTKPGNVLVSAWYNGKPANTVIQFVPSVNVRFAVTGFPYCSSAGQIITIDGVGYTCPTLTSTTFSWAPGTVHNCAINSIVSVNSVTRGACKTNNLVCTAGQNTTLTINCTPQYYLTESANPVAGGSVSPGSNWYNDSTRVSISQTPNSGYTFYGWTGVGSGSYTGSSASNIVTMNSPATETATYSLSVTFTESGLAGGTSWAVTLGSNTLSSTGSTITFTNQPASLLSWSTNAIISCGAGCEYSAQPSSGTANTIGGSVSQGITYTTQYYLTMNPPSNGVVSPSSSGWYNSGNTIMLTATPNSGYTFNGWTGSGSSSYTGTNTPVNIVITSPVAETANFIIPTPSLPTYTCTAGGTSGSCSQTYPENTLSLDGAYGWLAGSASNGDCSVCIPYEWANATWTWDFGSVVTNHNFIVTYYVSMSCGFQTSGCGGFSQLLASSDGTTWQSFAYNTGTIGSSGSPITANILGSYRYIRLINKDQVNGIDTVWNLNTYVDGVS